MRPERAEKPAEEEAAAGPILVVEDNEVNALIIRAMLRKHGYDPHLATSGAEGIAMTARLRPRLILMDLQMPSLDGFEAASAIRRSAGGADPVIVAVTANTAGDVRRACREAGFAGVLAKPIVIEDLIALVHRFVA
jgi:CheY-like chemotaxis protein